jgi:hypothetical protein
MQNSPFNQTTSEKFDIKLKSDYGVNFLYRIPDDSQAATQSATVNPKIPGSSYVSSQRKSSASKQDQASSEAFSAAKHYRRRKEQIEKYLNQVSL